MVRLSFVMASAALRAEVRGIAALQHHFEHFAHTHFIVNDEESQ